MSSMSKDLEKKIADKFGKMFMNIGEKSTRDCWLFGNYEPKISIELLENTIKNCI